MSSPFDLALSRPLIDDQTAIEEQINKTNTNNSNNSSSNSNSQHATYTNKLTGITPNHDNHYQPPSASTSTSLPHLSDDDEEQSLLLTQLTSNSTTGLGTQIDSALLSERYQESQHITQQMRQINAINQDLAHLVSSQQDTIDVIEQDAYEIHERAEMGVGHLQKAKEMMRDGMRGEGLMRVFFFVLAVGGTFIALVLLLEAL
jgi:hypothetical protein